MVSLHPDTGGIAAMMGVKDRVFNPLPRDFSLEDLVPRDSFYRRLEERLDLSFVRALVAPLYARGGRPSVDPVVFFKLQLVMFFEGVRSERELMRVAADRLSVRWYLGYDLDEPLPDHSNLTRTRERFGLAVFRRFFEEVVELCAEAGLVRGDELFFDSTKARIILNALVAPAGVSENRPMLDLLWRTVFRCRLRPRRVVADGIYGTVENVAAVERAGVRAYLSLHEAGGKPGFFPKNAFSYDAEKDVYTCPRGETLRYWNTWRPRRVDATRRKLSRATLAR